MKHLKTLKQRLQEEQQPQKAIYNTIKSHEKHNTRLNKRITRILDTEHAYFITFTLDDAHINLKQKSHIKKITQALSQANVIDYTLNNDYGDLTNRLHYHCIATFSLPLNYTTIQQDYQYGALNIKKIINKDIKALSEYIQKLKNHTIKNSVHFITYKRSPKYPLKHNAKEILT
jgi:hypothetical protein